MMNKTTEEVSVSKENENIKTYTREEILTKSNKYFNGDELAAEVWLNKYCLKDSAGNFYESSPDDMHKRIAKELARIESKFPKPMSENKIYNLIKNFKYIVPQGSPMSGIGNDFQTVSLSNCFVIGNDIDADSYGGIFKLDQEIAQLQKRRAGVGLDLSFIRPKGSPVQNSALTSTGIVPFMERFSNTTREVAQDGRRGALMQSISIKHPDSESFIDAKMEQGKVTGANISVKLHDDFMKAAFSEEDNNYKTQFPIDSDNPQFIKTINAKNVWGKVVHNAWKSAEPGVLFWDTVINESIPDCYADLGFKTISTNPCGEITLCADDSCRLTALNLYSYVINPFTKDAYFDFELFKEHVEYAQKIMDDIIELELEKIDKIISKIKKDPELVHIKTNELNMWKNIKNKCEQGRRTGLGITAEGDMLAGLNLKYGTDEGNKFSERIHKELKLSAYSASVDMAKDRGAFKICDMDREKNNPFILRIKDEDPKLHKKMLKYGRRNIALLTIAPTGTVSLMTQTSSGIECAFMIYYKRRRKINPQEKNVKVDFVDEIGDSWQEYSVFHHRFNDYLSANGYDPEKVKMMDDEKIDKIIKKSPYYGATSNDVDWVKKVEMQGMIQKHIDHSISVTVNLPNTVDEKLVSDVYRTAWEHGCKGVTIYRDGSRSGVLISKDEKKDTNTIKKTSAPKRPKTVDCDIHHVTAQAKKWIVIVGLLENEPYEVFAFKTKKIHLPTSIKNGELVKIKKGYYNLECDNDFVIENVGEHFESDEQEALTRMISMGLRHGADIQYVVEQLNKSEGNITAFSKAVARTLKKYIKDGTKTSMSCDSCGSENVQYQEGCVICLDCGNGKCG